MEEITYEININATKERVWKVLWDDTTFREWAGIIDPGTYMIGDLKEGNEVQYISAENGYGVTSLVEKVVPNVYLLIHHSSDTQDFGKQTRDKEWTGGNESYTLTENNGSTTLTVKNDMPPSQVEYFSQIYPKVLQKIKELAEK